VFEISSFFSSSALTLLEATLCEMGYGLSTPLMLFTKPKKTQFTRLLEVVEPAEVLPEAED